MGGAVRPVLRLIAGSKPYAYYDGLGFNTCAVKSAYGPSEYYRAKFLQGEPQDLSHCEARLAPTFASLDE